MLCWPRRLFFKRRLFGFLVLVTAVLSAVHFWYITITVTPSVPVYVSLQNVSSLTKLNVIKVGGFACQLPKLDPFHPSMMEHMSDSGLLRCGAGPGLRHKKLYITTENNKIRIRGPEIKKASYSIIQRTPASDSDTTVGEAKEITLTKSEEGKHVYVCKLDI